jgi:L-alanine-DL-glutamate epimerase-like enolase superfamily enzyme
MALWDISGKAFGVPVHQLLGGKQRDRLRVYASGGMEKPAEELRQEIAKYIEMGFTGVKIRGGYSVEKDLKILALAKETAGNKADVMIDVGQNYVPNPWSTVEAIKACGKLGELDPYWIEEPFCTDNPQAYAQVTRSSNVPIAGGENAATLHEFRQLIDNNAIDIVQPDASHAGGVWETLKIANYAKIHGKSMAPHNFRSGVTLAAHLHILASISNALILEYQTIPNPLRTELLIEPLEPHKGWIDVPDLPGLGVLLTDRLIEKYPFKQGKVQRFKIEQPG